MTIILDFVVLAIVWIFVYSVSEDILKLLSKYMFIFTALIIFYEMMTVYSDTISQVLFAGVLALLIIEIVIDTLYNLVQKPLLKTAGVKR